MANRASIQTSTFRLERAINRFGRNWWLSFSLLFGIYVGLPFLAPVLMHKEWILPARAIYFVYSFFCHQLPERSFFFFGSQTMYSLNEIQAVWKSAIDPFILRQFVGTPELGWKVAWSDRMVFMYTSIWIFGLFWWPLRRWIRPLPWWGFILLLLPMVLDGTTHFISDLWGIEQGFRQANLWLAELTRHAFSADFYAGNALGSFNSWMRWISGSLFGLGMVWFGFPYLDEAFTPAQPQRSQLQ